MEKELNRIFKFLKANGWQYDEGCTGEYVSYVKDDCIGVDIGKDEIVLIDETGDFLHMPFSYYAIVGALVCTRQIPFSFKEV